MYSRIHIVIAALLTACGAVATTGDNATESVDADQGSRRGKQKQPAEEDPAIKAARDMAGWDEGGMPGCFDPSLSGRERAVAERLGGVPCEGGNVQQASGDRWPGAYGGLEIAAAGPNRYSVRVEIAAPGCGGEIAGTASGSGDRLVMSAPPPVPGDYRQCRLDLEHRGASVRVTSDGDCYLFHGAQCEGFDGDYRRERSANAAPTGRTAATRPAPQSVSWIIGTWVLPGGDCNGEIGITYFPSGSYATHMDAGLWRLHGNTLTHTATETYTAGDASSRRAIPNPQPSRSQVIARTSNSFTHRSVSSVRLVRCPN